MARLSRKGLQAVSPWLNRPRASQVKNVSLTDQSLIFDSLQKLKSILAVFALLVFLFPQVEKEIHNHEHAVNVRCTEHDVVHFHNVEHHCFLCDFTSPVSPTSTIYKTALAEHHWNEGQFFFTEFSYSLQSKDFHSLRGPPTIA